MTTLKILDDTNEEGFILKNVNDDDFYWCNGYAEEEKQEFSHNYIFYNNLLWNARLFSSKGYILLDGSFLPKKRRVKKSESYVALTHIDRITDKSYGIITGTNGKVGSGYKVFFEYIAFSICKEIDNKIYCPLWIANSFSDNFDFNDKITIKL